MTDKPETAADVLAEMKQQTRDRWTSDARLCRFADRIERAMAASAVPVAWVPGLEATVDGWICAKAFRAGEFTTPLYAHAPPAVPVESLGRDADYPECSGDPASCPENEGYGCCKPNPPTTPEPRT